MGDRRRLPRLPRRYRPALYSRTLFDFTAGMNPYLAQGLELGRSFVQPGYWGKRSLDYLWRGIGAYLNQHPHYRYLFGPVSLSGAYPRDALELLVHFYERHFPTWQQLAVPRNPFLIPAERRAELDARYPGTSYREEFQRLKSELAERKLGIPTLYKQYGELCDVGGVQFAAFNIDPSFGHCVDGGGRRPRASRRRAANAIWGSSSAASAESDADPRAPVYNALRPAADPP